VRPLVLSLRFVAVLVLGGIVTSLSVAAITPTVKQFLDANDAETSSIALDELSNNSFLFDLADAYVGTLHGAVNRENVSLAEMADTTKYAVLAVEDADFYSHNGVNARSIARALVSNVNAGGITQGGSTITQQLVKNLVLDDDRQQVERKIPEAALALRLEDQMSKDQILELYLNTVYFGAGAYGVKAAASVYFDKAPHELDWAESALLASLISSPSSLDPTRNPEGAQRGRRLALRRIEEEGYITPEQRAEYEQAPLPLVRVATTNSLEAPEKGYFLEEVKQQLLKLPELGKTVNERAEKIFAGGLRIYTTFDPRAQAAAEAAVADTLARVNDERFSAALAAVEPGTGAVRAIIGGPGFDRFKFNIATQKGRPTGSSMKAFVLAAAMEAGIVPADSLDGTGPCSFPNKGGTPDPYESENFGGSPGSFGDLTSQTLRSSNCGYLRLTQIVGPNNVISVARALGVTSRLEPILALPLGVFDITPLEMANAYAAFPNDGVRTDAYFVRRIEDRDGKVIYEHRSETTRAISTQSARLVTQVLEKNVLGGTGTRARLRGQPAAGKTGTSSDFSDAWFVGYTPYLSTAVWMGNPEAAIEMRNVGGVSGVTGGSFPAAIWGEFNAAYHDGREVRRFAPAEPTREGRTLRTPADDEAYKDFVLSLCGEQADETSRAVDTDGDGVPDRCDATTRVAPREGACPALLQPTDTDGDGEPDTCVPIPPATTVTTTTAPPSTTAPPTSRPPSTSGPPTSSPGGTRPPGSTTTITTPPSTTQPPGATTPPPTTTR
jgi:membrane peptidoglycan carboxypeptidase